MVAARLQPAAAPRLRLGFMHIPGMLLLLQHVKLTCCVNDDKNVFCPAAVPCFFRGVVHRDIKPDNLLVSRPLDSPQELTADLIKVTDFGISVPLAHGQVRTVVSGSSCGCCLAGTLWLIWDAQGAALQWNCSPCAQTIRKCSSPLLVLSSIRCLVLACLKFCHVAHGVLMVGMVTLRVHVYAGMTVLLRCCVSWLAPWATWPPRC